jgi:esterase FrsA
MNDVDELTRYAVLHARGQQISRYQKILDRVRTDGADPGSWAGEWSREAEELERRGRHLEAARHFALARFPYPGDQARAQAQDRCVAAFERWRGGTGIERLEIDLPEGRLVCLATGLSADRPRPVLLLMGGIVSVKEQNAAALADLDRLGLAGIVTEMPGVGENTLPYSAGSWRMLSQLLDAVADRADVSRTYAIAMSFSGHLALRCAVTDDRIRAVVTVGAPVSRFFTDAGWQRQLPALTVDTLAYLLGTGRAEVPGQLRGWALQPEELAALTVPVRYTASRRDEIIPPGDPDLLRASVPDVRILEHDDVHGAPAHIAETRLWSMAEVLRIHGAPGPQRLVIGALWQASRLRARVSHPAAAPAAAGR